MYLIDFERTSKVICTIENMEEDVKKMKSFPRLIISVLVLLCLLTPLSVAEDEEGGAAIDLFWCDTGKTPVRLDRIYGNGTNAGVVAEVTNVTGRTVALKVTRGMALSPGDPSIQSMVVVRNQLFRVPSGASGLKIEIDALCMNARLEPPGLSDSLRIDRQLTIDAIKKLDHVLKAVDEIEGSVIPRMARKISIKNAGTEKVKLGYSGEWDTEVEILLHMSKWSVGSDGAVTGQINRTAVVQYAIWSVTDGYGYGELVEKIGEEYPDYSSEYREELAARYDDGVSYILDKSYTAALGIEEPEIEEEEPYLVAEVEAAEEEPFFKEKAEEVEEALGTPGVEEEEPFLTDESEAPEPVFETPIIEEEPVAPLKAEEPPKREEPLVAYTYGTFRLRDGSYMECYVMDEFLELSTYEGRAAVPWKEILTVTGNRVLLHDGSYVIGDYGEEEISVMTLSGEFGFPTSEILTFSVD